MNVDQGHLEAWVSCRVSGESDRASKLVERGRPCGLRHWGFK